MTKREFAFLLFGALAGGAVMHGLPTQPEPQWMLVLPLPSATDRIETIDQRVDEIAHKLTRETEAKPRDEFVFTCSLFHVPRAD